MFYIGLFLLRKVRGTFWLPGDPRNLQQSVVQVPTPLSGTCIATLEWQLVGRQQNGRSRTHSGIAAILFQGKRTLGPDPKLGDPEGVPEQLLLPRASDWFLQCRQYAKRPILLRERLRRIQPVIATRYWTNPERVATSS
jgi:hypothetical protein